MAISELSLLKSLPQMSRYFPYIISIERGAQGIRTTPALFLLCQQGYLYFSTGFLVTCSFYEENMVSFRA